MSHYNFYKALGSPAMVSEEQLSYLVTEARKYQAGSAERQKILTKIIRSIANKLWKENTPYYQDALQQTWLYFCQNICEGNAGNPYDPNRASLVTWLNFYLKKRLQDFYINNQKEKFTKASTPIDPLDSGGTNQAVELIETIPAPPDVPPLLEEVKEWVETDPEGELRQIYITNHPEITCQVLILRRLPPETSWKTLSAEFNLPISTLSSFYQRQCLPCLRKFAESQGYF
jgi:hypothetical protein